MDNPMLKLPNGSNPTENTSYVLRCDISESNPNPVTRYEWLQDGNVVNGSATILSFPSVKRTKTGSWVCRGIIDENNVKFEKNSTPAEQVRVFCK